MYGRNTGMWRQRRMWGWSEFARRRYHMVCKVSKKLFLSNHLRYIFTTNLIWTTDLN